MDFDKLQKTWDALGDIDPFWAILSFADKAGNKWDVAEFFRTGEIEIDELMAYVDRIAPRLDRRRVLDFGCGAGRLSQALCRHFEECHGVDIAPSMISLANRFNGYAGRCHYHLNSATDLRLFDDNAFSFLYSNIVLQHMKTEYSMGYVAEFLRVLAPGGVAVFQIPEELLTASAAGHTALPDAAFRGKIRVMNAPTQLSGGDRRVLYTKVRNVSEHTWPRRITYDEGCPVRLGSRWRPDEDRSTVVDDGRSDLPQSLGPGEEVDVELTITAPRRAGTYLLEVDLVQELVAWFRDKGSFASQSIIEVLGAPASAGDSELLIPQIEMYAVTRDVVADVVTRHGGSLLDVREDDWAGPSWRSLRYCVQKPA